MISVKVIALIAIYLLKFNLAKSIQIGSNDVRIVGGVNAIQGQAPYQCSMQLNGRHFCGCSILNANWILTAGHCVAGMNVTAMKIMVGSIDLRKPGKLYNALNGIVHDSHNQPRFSNDIAVVRVNSSIKFDNLVRPIELWPYEVQPNAKLQLTGWGRLSAGGEIPNILQIINLTSISNEKCLKEVGTDLDVGHMCTFTAYGEGACNGDSGGPLTYNGKLVGVVNFGVPCAFGVPDVYARISYYHDWIRQRVDI